MINRYEEIEHIVDSLVENHPIDCVHITLREIEQLLRYPVESYTINLHSPTVLSDIVFNFQRMGLGEFSCEKEIFDLIVIYESLYNLNLDKVIETFNEIIRRYYARLSKEREKLVV